MTQPNSGFSTSERLSALRQGLLSAVTARNEADRVVREFERTISPDNVAEYRRLQEAARLAARTEGAWRQLLTEAENPPAPSGAPVIYQILPSTPPAPPVANPPTPDPAPEPDQTVPPQWWWQYGWRREPYEWVWPVVSLLLLTALLAFLLGSQCENSWWERNQPPQAAAPAPVLGPTKVEVIIPSIVIPQLPAQAGGATASCAVDNGNGQPFWIAGEPYQGFRVSPCSGGIDLPPGTLVYTDSGLEAFDVQVAKFGDPNSRFVGFIQGELPVKLSSDSAFWYIPNADPVVGIRWAQQLAEEGHSVRGLTILRQEKRSRQ